MNKKIQFTLGMVICLLIGVYWFWQFTHTTTINIQNTETNTFVEAEVLINSFLENEAQSNKQFKSKVVEVTGIVKTISFTNNRYTVILQGKNNDHHVLCDLKALDATSIKSISHLKKVRIKGICKGFLKDVILLNCIIINHKSYE